MKCVIMEPLAVHLIYTDSTFIMYWQNNEPCSIKYISKKKQVIMIARYAIRFDNNN